MIKNLLLFNIPKLGISFLCLSFIIFPSFLKAQQQVTWVDMVGVSLNVDNTLTKTAPYGSDNGGAASEQILPAGVDGWVEMTVLENDKSRYIGLSDVNSGISPSTIDYSIQFGSADHHANAYENGVRIGYAGFTGNYGQGEVFRIERVGTTIYYKRNGNVFYTSTVPSTTALVVDVCFVHTGATIHNARVSFGDAAPLIPGAPNALVLEAVSSNQIDLSWSDNSDNETGFEIERSLTSANGYSLVHTTASDVISYSDAGLAPNTTYYYRVRAISATGTSAYTQELSASTSPSGGGGTGEGSQVTWVDMVGVSLNVDNTLTKTAAYGSDNGGAASEQILPAGVDGWVEMTVLENDKSRYIGLSDVNSGISPSTIDYSIQFSGADHHANAYENGVRIGYAGFTGNYEQGEVFRIERVGTTIYYKRNGNVFYTSTVPSTTALVVDVCLVHTSATIHNARVSFGDAVVEELLVTQPPADLVQNRPSD